MRQALLVLFAAFEGEKRENSDEPLCLHTLRGAEKMADILGPDAAVPLVKYLLHDTKEDRGVTDQTIRDTFGDEVADGVERYTIIKQIPRHPDPLVRESKRLVPASAAFNGR